MVSNLNRISNTSEDFVAQFSAGIKEKNLSAPDKKGTKDNLEIVFLTLPLEYLL